MSPSSFLLRCNGRGLRSAVARAPGGRMGPAPCQPEVAAGKMEPLGSGRQSYNDLEDATGNRAANPTER